MVRKEISNVFFEAERLKYENVGLYHFCKNLGNALIEESSHNHKISFHIFGPKNDPNFSNYPNFKSVKLIDKISLSFNSQVDIWHSTYQFSSYIPKSKRIKNILTVHDLNFLREKSESKQKGYLKKLQRNIDRVDTIVCISNFVAEELKKHIDIKGKEVSIIYNGNNINNTIEGKEFEIPGMDSTKPFLFYIGAILPKKNIQILPYLLKNNSFNLIISGQIFDVNYVDSIKELTHTLGIENRVFFTGPISEQEKIYFLKNCAFFCFPSLTEGFGLPVVEAMNYGKPLLLSSATCLPEIAGDEAFYFESYDAEYLIQLGEKISVWTQTEEQKSKLIERSKEFSWQKAAKEYMKLYLKLSDDE